MSKGIVVPGDILFPISEKRRPGQGTFELHGSIYASLAGHVFIKEDRRGEKVTEIIEVRYSDGTAEHAVPYIGGIVTARVLHIGQRFAKCQLLLVEDTPLSSEFSANLRREDIRATDKDKIDLPKCVLPGDVILARVISFGDNQTSFLISTAEDELGVLFGMGENGERMDPFDWNTVQGVRTKAKEPRKVAQVPKMKKDQQAS